ncbi:MAG: biotin/lipoyl-binding protein [Acidobacteria bacterium]|nr:biotin/lipoyl-binding protein [Acidobacteriota bacterium]
MSLEVRIGGRNRRVDLRRDGDRYRGRVGKRSVEAEVTERGPYSLLIRLGKRTFDVTFDEAGTTLLLDLGSRQVAVEIMDPLKGAAEGTGIGMGRGRREVRASMPGKVVAVKVKVGDEVDKGQGLIILEAMKMENEVASPCQGKVVELEVTPGQTVETGSLLAAVE